jgi:hypothetical protein
MLRILKMTIVAILLAASAATAQEQWDRFRGGYGRNRYPPRYPTATSFDGSFNFCRLMYTSDRREAGGSGWSTDYWDADLNFSTRLGELTKTTISRQANGDPNHLTIRISDPALFQCPILSATDVGTALFTDDEAETLRAYLEKGGFLWVDDFWGPYAWDNWVSNISKVLPPGEYPIRDIPHYLRLFQTYLGWRLYMIFVLALCGALAGKRVCFLDRLQPLLASILLTARAQAQTGVRASNRSDKPSGPESSPRTVRRACAEPRTGPLE